MKIMLTTDLRLFVAKVSYVCDLLELFKEHVLTGANYDELPADPII